MLVCRDYRSQIGILAKIRTRHGGRVSSRAFLSSSSGCLKNSGQRQGVITGQGPGYTVCVREHSTTTAAMGEKGSRFLQKKATRHEGTVTGMEGSSATSPDSKTGEGGQAKWLCSPGGRRCRRGCADRRRRGCSPGSWYGVAAGRRVQHLLDVVVAASLDQQLAERLGVAVDPSGQQLGVEVGGSGVEVVALIPARRRRPRLVQVVAASSAASPAALLVVAAPIRHRLDAASFSLPSGRSSGREDPRRKRPVFCVVLASQARKRNRERETCKWAMAVRETGE
ncbi:hypothetical protein U9M48_005053, partial [Paspalum notatum var. saurae]